MRADPPTILSFASRLHSPSFVSKKQPTMSLPQDLNMDDLPSQPYASPRLLKWFYCTNRVSSSLFLLPIWAIKYAVKKRPRPSWSLAETLLVDFTRRVSAITDQAGVQHATRDPTEEPRIDDLKETRFSWVPGVSGELLSGALVDDQVKPLERVGTFIWERAEDVREDYAMLNAKDQELAAEDEDAAGGSAFGSRFSLAGGDKGDLVGIYFHGGGYTHFSAHESAQTSMIPRRLMQVRRLIGRGVFCKRRCADFPCSRPLAVRLLFRHPLCVPYSPL